MLPWCHTDKTGDFQLQREACCGDHKLDLGSTSGKGSLRQKSAAAASAGPAGVPLKMNGTRIWCERSLVCLKWDLFFVWRLDKRINAQGLLWRMERKRGRLTARPEGGETEEVEAPRQADTIRGKTKE